MRIKKLSDRLNQILNGLTADKIFNADLKEIAAAYKDLLNAFRLETGQSTGNLMIGGKFEIFDPERMKQNSKDMAELTKSIGEVKKLIGEIDGRIASSKKTPPGKTSGPSEEV